MCIVFFSCKKENAGDCFKPNGEMTTETRILDTFSVIRVYDKIDLVISQGPKFKVEVIAGKHLLSNIKTSVAEDVLTIKNNNKCNFVRGYKKRITVHITVPHLRKAQNEGVGNITFDENFNQDTLLVRAENSGDIFVNGIFNEIRTSSHGDGDIYLNGSCNTLYVYMFGTNFLKAENLSVSNYIFIETLSIGDCRVNAPDNGTLAYNLWRSGNIYYRGNPALITNFSDGTAKGKLIKE
ncbi:MAG: hypothetical protein JWO32_2874 [Bacteroidetes bacterium]|nr:hypothetical protein [Bacteroidota bacterium]